MEKYKYLLRKWWFWVLAVVFLLALFNGVWAILEIVAIAGLILGIINVVKNKNRRKNSFIIAVSIIYLITFISIRVVQYNNYVTNNPDEDVQVEKKENPKPKKKKAENEASTPPTVVSDNDDTEKSTDSVEDEMTKDDIEMFNDSINRLKNDSEHVLTKVVPFEGKYDTLIAYVIQDVKYESDSNKQKIADYLGSEIQKRSVASLFGGYKDKTPFVEIRYPDETKMAGSKVLDITKMKLTGK